MPRRLVVQLQADLDIQAAAVWYEGQQSGLGSRFLDELDAVLRRMIDNPRQFPRVEGNVYRALFRHFPYGVYFLAAAEDLHVLAVLHLHREPDMWKSRN